MKAFLKKYYGHITISVVAIFIFSFCIFVGSDEKPKPTAKETSTEVELDPLIKEVYITDSINDENLATVTEPLTKASYWFVKYELSVKSTQVEMRGWMVVELSTPYFDTHEAVIKIYPQYKEEDYVGLDFFKRVPYETYQSYIINK